MTFKERNAMNDLEKTFTIKITELPDGSVKLWTNAMPETRSLESMHVADIPKSHALGLFAIGRIMDAMDDLEAQGWTMYIEAQGWTMYEEEKEK